VESAGRSHRDPIRRHPIKHNVALAVTSLLSVLFTMVHLADDYSRGFSQSGISAVWVPPVLGIWVYATVLLDERRWGRIVILVMSLLAAGLPVLHLMGRSGITGGATPKSAGALFFAWTLLVVGAASVCAFMLSVRGLWSLRRNRAN
jgi:hypothetical protein